MYTHLLTVSGMSMCVHGFKKAEKIKQFKKNDPY